MAKQETEYPYYQNTANKFSQTCLGVLFLLQAVTNLCIAQHTGENDNKQIISLNEWNLPEYKKSGDEKLGSDEQKIEANEPGQDFLSQARKAYLAKNYDQALPFALQALSKFEISNNPNAKASVYQLLSSIYDQGSAYERALFYDQQLEKLLLHDPAKLDQLAALRFSICQRFIEIENYDEAEAYAQKSLHSYEQLNSTDRLTDLYETLLFIAQQQERYEDALNYAQWLQDEYSNQASFSHQLVALNNLGFIYQRLGEEKKAIESFKEAISHNSNINEAYPVILLINLGLAYSNLGNDRQALQYYEQALGIHKQNENRAGEAEISNYMASHYYLSGRQSNALETALEASQIALEEREWYTLLDSYRLLKLIYQKEKRDGKSKEYERKFLEIQDFLDNQARQKTEELEQIHQAALAKEEEIKAYWNEKEQNALSQERRETRLKLQEQELSLLKNEKELQSLALSKQVLESNNAKQALAIATQKLQAAQQERQLEALAKEKELQTLRLHRQKLEQDKQRQTIDLLETDRQLKEERLLKEANLRKYGYGILGLCISIIGIIAFSSVQKGKDNRRLRTQKAEILAKNELLYQNEQELKNHTHHLEQTQKLLADQKEELTLTHNRVQESIAYAKQIQESILPNEQYLQQLYPESFLIFMPKDIVSGDFYWFSQHDGYQILIVADCTGHGVPGALITLIGHSLLTEAIQGLELTDPSAILTFLHQKLLERFCYHESSRQHGMDLGICVIRPEGKKYQIHYAGAKNTLWFLKHNELSKIKGNRVSIGSSRKEVSFDSHTLQLYAGDKIYLSSDGFIDQPNRERKRFGSAQLNGCLRAWHRLPMADQKKHLLSAFADHQQEAEQRDDISLIGVSFQ